MSFSENAILTKSRAIYSRRLTPQNYRELLSCESVEAAASYLENKTPYSSAFSDVVSAKMNRMMLESLLRRNLSNQFLSLCNFSRILGNELYRYLVIKTDITEILSCIRYLETPNKYDYLINMPVFLDKMTTIDMYSLAKAENFGDIVEALDTTPYYKILSAFANDKNSFDMIKIESALNRYLFNEIFDISQKKLKGKEKKEFEEFLKMMADIKLLSNIYRLKTYFKMSRERIEEYSLETGVTSLGRKQLDEIKNSENREDFLKAVEKTVYGKKLEKNNFVNIEDWLSEYIYKEASHKAVYSTHPNVVMFCCVFLAENELQNITHIVEGIKYSIPPDELQKRLVGCGDLKEGDKPWQ